jgi:hypothetical protein
MRDPGDGVGRRVDLVQGRSVGPAIEQGRPAPSIEDSSSGLGSRTRGLRGSIGAGSMIPMSADPAPDIWT